jgi:hypothetical protein
MRQHLLVAIAAVSIASATAAVARADGWLFKPSTYSHDPVTGARVDQYATKEPSYARADGGYLESGYRHTQYSLRAGGTADRLHVVQTWGKGESIRPYGEWQYPFRAGATPYGPWGNPQGPWTTPFDSWVNPYGQWNQFPYLSTGPGYGGPSGPGPSSPYATPYPTPGPSPGPSGPTGPSGPPGPGHP